MRISGAALTALTAAAALTAGLALAQPASAVTARTATARTATARTATARTATAAALTAAAVTAPAAASARNWVPTRFTLPAGAGGGSPVRLRSMACPSAAKCVAVGEYQYQGTEDDSRALLLSGGTSWAAAGLPAAAEASGTSLSSVACPTTRLCVAVGTASSAGGLILTWSGRSWTLTRPSAPGPGSAITELSGVACPTATECLAVGTFRDSAGMLHGLLLTRSGSSWTDAQAPLPAGGSNLILSSVACSSSSQCAASGSFLTSAGKFDALMLTWAGSTWSDTPVPLPANMDQQSFGGLTALSCSASGHCVAVGGYADTSGAGRGLLVSGSGSSWTAAQAPVPAGAGRMQSVDLESVSCVALSCAAVGDYLDAAENEEGILLTGTGTSWTAVTAPLPANARPSQETGPTGAWSVTCPAAAQCTAAGGYVDSASHLQGLLLTLSGSTWTAAEAPLPANASASPAAQLFTVACPSAAHCAAAGVYTTSTGYVRGLALTGS